MGCRRKESLCELGSDHHHKQESHRRNLYHHECKADFFLKVIHCDVAASLWDDGPTAAAKEHLDHILNQALAEVGGAVPVVPDLPLKLVVGLLIEAVQ